MIHFGGRVKVVDARLGRYSAGGSPPASDRPAPRLRPANAPCLHLLVLPPYPSLCRIFQLEDHGASAGSALAVSARGTPCSVRFPARRPLPLTIRKFFIGLPPAAGWRRMGRCAGSTFTFRSASASADIATSTPWPEGRRSATGIPGSWSGRWISSCGRSPARRASRRTPCISAGGRRRSSDRTGSTGSSPRSGHAFLLRKTPRSRRRRTRGR
jgi:hypothetical protein